MMILGRNDIFRAIERNISDPEGGICIEPFNSDNVGANSVDLTLGNRLKVYSPRASYLDVLNKNLETFDLPIGPEGRVLEPGVLYLAHTIERTFTPEHRPALYGRSSLGRLGLGVHVTAGYGDLGFNGQWTLELTVVQPVKIYTGIKICQIEFANVTCLSDKDYRHLGRYNDQRGPTGSKGVQGED